MITLYKKVPILAKGRAFGHVLLALLVISSCQSCKSQQSHENQARPWYELQISSGQKVLVQLAISESDQIKGLSGIKPDQLKDNQGMLFVYDQLGQRSFWMPDTYMDLDLFYLDQNMRVIDVYRNLKHHPGRDEPPSIPRAPTVYAWHVLELKSSSPLAKEIRQFQQLNWTSGQNLPKILRDTHPQ